MAKEDVSVENPQWGKLQAMRAARGDVPPTPPKDPDTGRFVKVEKAPEPVAETPPPAETPAVPETPPVAATPETPPPPVDTTPRSVEIEMDGQKVLVDPSLAAAWTQATRVKADANADAERERIKAELREELKAELNPPKTEAEAAAEAALKAAEEAAKLPKKPDAQLMITDPAEYERQRDLYEEARVNAVLARDKAERATEQQRQAKEAAQATEQQARDILREQFYRAYPVLKDSASLVDPMLKEQFDAVVASGKLKKKLTPAEAEQMKSSEFADVAAKATRELVKLRRTSAQVAPPPPPPPTVVSSAPAKPAPKTVQEPEKPKEKYPKGSVSAALAERRSARERASA